MTARTSGGDGEERNTGLGDSGGLGSGEKLGLGADAGLGEATTGLGDATTGLGAGAGLVDTTGLGETAPMPLEPGGSGGDGG